MKKIAFILFCILLEATPFYISGQSALEKFSLQHQETFQKDYAYALKQLSHSKYRAAYHFSNGQCIHLVGMQNQVPLYYITHNAEVADFIGVTTNYIDSEVHSGLSGEGISIGIWDAGHVLTTHQEFLSDVKSRISIYNEIPNYINHSTHVGGTVAAFGVTPLAKGMAYRSNLNSYDYLNDVAEMALEADVHHTYISNHSYGPVNGWFYNTKEEKWYWYGDLGIDALEDYKFGYYGAIPAALDELACLAPNYLMVISAGNDRDDTPESQPVPHKVWTDKWVGSNDIREPDGGEDGYECIGMNAVAKNVLTVGAVDLAEDGAMCTFSAWGPTDDGRLKPDLSAPGTSIYSSMADSSDSYGYYTGTSMAAACVTGGLGLMLQLHEKFQPDVPLLSSTLKGLLIHTADECGPSDGPDYKYGWGLVNFSEAHNLMEDNISSGGQRILEENIEQGDVFEHSVNLAREGLLRVTIVWTDEQGEAVVPSLNPQTRNLVNDLDLTVENVNSGTVYYPWILDPENPQEAAKTGVNWRDNVEQVCIKNAAPGDYVIRIDGAGITGESQQVSVLLSGQSCNSGIYPPRNLDGFYASEGISLDWKTPTIGTPENYKVYRNGALVSTDQSNTFLDKDISYLEEYAYQVVACYSESEIVNSLPTNDLSIKALPLVALDAEENFESSPVYWSFADNAYGWRWGDQNSLASYYLKFDGNSTSFMGVNSDALGNGEHVRDYLMSVPFNVPTTGEFIVQFNYLFNNESYATNDILQLYYRKGINEEWILLDTIPSNQGWNAYEIKCKLAEDEGVIQLGFLYDDNAEWGFGAGIDDVRILKNGFNTSIPVVEEEQNLVCFQDENRNIYLQFTNGKESLQQVEVYDITGKKLSIIDKVNGQGNLVLPLKAYPPGSYIVVVKSSMSRYTRKIVLY